MTYIESLQDAIRRLHGCESEYIESVPVTETFQGKTVWQGTVEVFVLRNHPKAKRCYAWSSAAGKGDSETRFVAVLELPPVDSPQTAVQVAVASELKRERAKTS